MSAREWKPGDVALVDGHVALVWDEEDGDGRLSFVYTDSDGDPCSTWADTARAHPLVVIDPEDAEQVERLLDEFRSLSGWASSIKRESANAMQHALREFANPSPPKPPEPQGLGAVVEDAEGRQFVRIQTHYTCPWLQRGVAGVLWKWENVAAVKVLSEGVPA